jgi:hypothetical protein
MRDNDTALRFHAINKEAADLGYRIEVDFVSNRPTPVYRAYAHALAGAETTSPRFLCSSSSSLEAAEDALQNLRDIVERGDSWPDAP